MSDTPRTDAVAERRNTWNGSREQDAIDLARELERENAKLREELADVKRRIAHVCNALN